MKTAFAHYRLAAWDGVVPAQVKVSISLKNGKNDIKREIEEALRWLHKASDAGDAEAHYELGLLYETGEGVAVDKVQAYKLYQKAVDGGFAKAADKLKALLATLSDAERTAISEPKK